MACNKTCKVIGECHDLILKQHDTLPPFIVSVTDCGGPLDLEETIAEVSMWAKAKLKVNISNSEDLIQFADNRGFYQVHINDIIVMDHPRSPEQMLVIGIDEDNCKVQVQRGYNGSRNFSHKKGQSLKIFRILNAVAETHMIYEDIENIEGTVSKELIDSQLVYKWLEGNTCLPGDYYLEFKLLKMTEPSSLYYEPMYSYCVSQIIQRPSTISLIPTYLTDVTSCSIGQNVEWVRRFPIEREGFLIRIVDTPTSENLL